MKHRLPDILATETAVRSALFRVEALELRFSNGARRRFERIAANGMGAAVLVVPWSLSRWTPCRPAANAARRAASPPCS